MFWSFSSQNLYSTKFKMVSSSNHHFTTLSNKITFFVLLFGLSFLCGLSLRSFCRNLLSRGFLCGLLLCCNIWHKLGSLYSLLCSFCRRIGAPLMRLLLFCKHVHILWRCTPIRQWIGIIGRKVFKPKLKAKNL